MKNQNEMILMQDLSVNEMKEANGGLVILGVTITASVCLKLGITVGGLLLAGGVVGYIETANK